MKYLGLILSSMGFITSLSVAMDFAGSAEYASMRGYIVAALWAANCMIKDIIALNRKQ